MKRNIFVVLTAMVALNIAATNRFYLPDFTICPGETMQVAMILENDSSFTAFQTDLMLPQGLSVVEDDGDYLLDLTSRNASDQAIISKLRPDGALRMVSFCMSVKPFTGNNGPLVIINLVADEDFSGPATISLRNSFFVTVEGNEYILPSENLDVQIISQQMWGDANGDELVDINDVTLLISYVLAGCSTSFHTENADMNGDGIIDINDVTRLIEYVLSGR